MPAIGWPRRWSHGSTREKHKRHLKFIAISAGTSGIKQLAGGRCRLRHLFLVPRSITGAVKRSRRASLPIPGPGSRLPPSQPCPGSSLQRVASRGSGSCCTPMRPGRRLRLLHRVQPRRRTARRKPGPSRRRTRRGPVELGIGQRRARLCTNEFSSPWGAIGRRVVDARAPPPSERTTPSVGRTGFDGGPLRLARGCARMRRGSTPGCWTLRRQCLQGAASRNRRSWYMNRSLIWLQFAVGLTGSDEAVETLGP